jgi:hypothetical protein
MPKNRLRDFKGIKNKIKHTPPKLRW